MKRVGYVAGLLALFLLIVVATLFISRSKNPVDAANLVAGYVATPAFLVPCGMIWLFSRLRSKHKARPHAQAMLNALDSLAAAQLDDVRSEAAERRLLDIAPAGTSWRVGRDVPRSDLPFDGMLLPAIAGASEDIAGSSPDASTVENLHALYSAGPGTRLAILGNPGSGKSTMLILLLLAALLHRIKHSDQRRDIPVPVILPVADWDPKKQKLRTWVCESIYTRHRYLRAPEYGADVVSELLRAGRLSLFLDGLDELPEKRRIVALEQISKEFASRVVVTCRRKAFQAVESKLPLPRLTTVEIEPLRHEAIARYLTAAGEASRNSEWAAVAEAVISDPTGNLATGLNTPLTLSLARIGFADSPNQLLELAVALPASAFRQLLLAKFIEMTYPDIRTRERAQKFFALAATRLGRRTTFYWTDIRTWVIPRWDATSSILLMTGGGFLGLSHNWIGRFLGPFVLGLAGSLAGRPVRWTAIRLPKKQEIQQFAKFSTIFYGAILLIATLIPASRKYYAVGIILATVSLIGAGMLEIWRSPVTTDQIRIATARRQLHTDIFGGIAFSLTLAVGLSLVLGIGTHRPEEFIHGAVCGIAFGFGINETTLLFAGGLWIGLRGRGPYNIVRFIMQAQRRQVLIQYGGGYQFRHFALKQAFLKTTPPAPAKPPASPADI